MADEIVVGASVVTVDGRELGHVKKVEPSAFLVDAPKQFDYWLQINLVKESTAERLDLTITEAELGGHKMDRPYDHNEFQAQVPERLKPASVRDSLLGR
jgi:hypothetical protein